jgi:hypothetical protein
MGLGERERYKERQKRQARGGAVDAWTRQASVPCKQTASTDSMVTVHALTTAKALGSGRCWPLLNQGKSRSTEAKTMAAERTSECCISLAPTDSWRAAHWPSSSAMSARGSLLRAGLDACRTGDHRMYRTPAAHSVLLVGSTPSTKSAHTAEATLVQ